MYPYFRFFCHQQKTKYKSKFEYPFEEDTVTMRVLPWDIDIFMELNNGRYLTLMDIGRFNVGARAGLLKVLKQNRWGLMVGATSSRYRYRLKLFEKFTLHTKMISIDARWFYFHQWFVGKNNKINASFLVRTAVTCKKGLVPTHDVINAMHYDLDILEELNQPSDWIKKWEESDEIHKKIMEG